MANLGAIMAARLVLSRPSAAANSATKEPRALWRVKAGSPAPCSTLCVFGVGWMKRRRRDHIECATQLGRKLTPPVARIDEQRRCADAFDLPPAPVSAPVTSRAGACFPFGFSQFCARARAAEFHGTRDPGAIFAGAGGRHRPEPQERAADSELPERRLSN